MQNLIKGGQLIENDPWQIFEAQDAQGLPGSALLPVSIWKETGMELLESVLDFGVYIQENENIDELAPYLKKMKVIAFQFGKFADGRAYTYARQLRDQLGYENEIRAVGDFMPDQVNYLQRCGFNAFACRNAEEAVTALAIKDSLPAKYQSDTIEPAPRYRRR